MPSPNDPRPPTHYPKETDMTDLHNSYANARDKNIALDVTPVTGTIGAIVNGVQLSGDLPAATVQAIQAALVRHKVLFFRDQQHLTDAEHEDFAALLGDRSDEHTSELTSLMHI